MSENLELIRTFWESSYFDRKKLLLELTTNEYMKKFPAFNLYNGYELVKYHVVRICTCRPFMSILCLEQFFKIYNLLSQFFFCSTISVVFVCSLFWMLIKFLVKDLQTYTKLRKRFLFLRTDKNDRHRI